MMRWFNTKGDDTTERRKTALRPGAEESSKDVEKELQGHRLHKPLAINLKEEKSALTNKTRKARSCMERE